MAWTKHGWFLWLALLGVLAIRVTAWVTLGAPRPGVVDLVLVGAFVIAESFARRRGWFGSRR
jgi:hypothetical protein